MKSIKKFCAVLIMMSAAGIVSVFAQVSNINMATAGTILSDADKFMSVKYFDEVDFDKIYTFTNLSSSNFQLGIGTRFSNTYLGLYYNGNFWGNLTSSGNKDKYGFEVDSSSEITEKVNNHKIDVLLGLGNMGFKLDTILNLGPSKITRNKNDASESVTKRMDNIYSFELDFAGLDINLRKCIFSPNISLGVAIYDNSSVLEENDIYGDLINKETYKNNSCTEVAFALGADFNFKSDLLKKSLLSMFYNFRCDIYPKNNYIKEDKEYILEETIINKKMILDDIIAVGYAFEYSPVYNLTIAGNIQAGAEFNSNIGGASVAYKYTVDHNGVKTIYDNVFTAIVRLSFNAGVKYNISPDFAVNLGYIGNLPNYARQSVTYPGGNVSYTNITGEYTNRLSAGFAWNIGGNCLLDCGVYTNLTPSLESIWKTGWNIAFSFKK